MSNNYLSNINVDYFNLPCMGILPYEDAWDNLKQSFSKTPRGGSRVLHFIAAVALSIPGVNIIAMIALRHFATSVDHSYLLRNRLGKLSLDAENWSYLLQNSYLYEDLRSQGCTPLGALYFMNFAKMCPPNKDRKNVKEMIRLAGAIRDEVYKKPALHSFLNKVIEAAEKHLPCVGLPTSSVLSKENMHTMSDKIDSVMRNVIELVEPSVHALPSEKSDEGIRLEYCPEQNRWNKWVKFTEGHY